MTNRCWSHSLVATPSDEASQPATTHGNMKRGIGENMRQHFFGRDRERERERFFARPDDMDTDEVCLCARA